MNALERRTPLPVAAGVLALVASFVVLAISMIFLQDALTSWTYVILHGRHETGYFFYYLAVGIFGLVSFPFGLASGIFVLQRRKKRFSMFSLSLLVFCGTLVFLSVFVFGLSILLVSLFGLPILVPSILGIVCVVLSKDDFR
jgi:hypothetical protein